MADDNKPLKYARYAIGEIVLVVVGIVIALALNNNNEKEKSETKALVLFDELLEELASNINSIKNEGLFYAGNDSLAYLVLYTDLTKEDYQNNYYSYKYLTEYHKPLALSNNSYLKLLQISEAIPNEYSEVMKELYKLNQGKIYVDLMTNRMDQYVIDIQDFQIYNYPWAVDFNQQEHIDYFYSDSRYKSDVKLLSIYGAGEHFAHAIYYMKRAVRCYRKIATLRNKTVDYNLLGADPKISKTLIGDWESEQAPGVIVTLYEEDHHLRNKNNIDSDIGTYYFLSKTKFIDISGAPLLTFLTIVNEENETIVKLNGGVVYKKRSN